MHDAVAILVLIAAGLFLPITLTFLVVLWEKRLVWHFAPVDESLPVAALTLLDASNPYATSGLADADPAHPQTAYTAQATAAAASLDFRPLGVFHDAKGRLYRIRYEFWLSPGCDVLALFGGGTIAGIRLDNTWLFTRLADGRCLRTLDTQPGSEFDLAGLADEALIPRVDFAELVARHRNRAAVSRSSPIPYSEDDVLGDHRAYCVRRAELMKARGYIRFLDAERNAWRFRLRGALLWTIRAHFLGLRRNFWSDARLKPGAGNLRKFSAVP